MAYSSVDDLLLGDMMVSAAVDKNRFVLDAAEEIDSKLGFIYTLPLAPVPPALTLLTHETLLLKQMNNKLASGRLILTLDIAGEGTALHAYGLRLVTEAMNELMLIANGSVELSAVRRALGGTLRDLTPRVLNHDEESGVDMFESAALRPGESATWQPGDARSAYPYYVSPSTASGTVYPD